MDRVSWVMTRAEAHAKGWAGDRGTEGSKSVLFKQPFKRIGEQVVQRIQIHDSVCDVNRNARQRLTG
jgi:hypothetical protein